MTELSFLIDLLLNHDLPAKTKHVIAERIKEVESNLVAKPIQQQIQYHVPNMPAQAPSTLALMAKHGELPPIMPAPQMPAPEPVAVIAQTPATAAAMNHRNETIAQALSGKVDKTTGRPRKW